MKTLNTILLAGLMTLTAIPSLAGGGRDGEGVGGTLNISSSKYHPMKIDFVTSDGKVMTANLTGCDNVYTNGAFVSVSCLTGTVLSTITIDNNTATFNKSNTIAKLSIADFLTQLERETNLFVERINLFSNQLNKFVASKPLTITEDANQIFSETVKMARSFKNNTGTYPHTGTVKLLNNLNTIASQLDLSKIKIALSKLDEQGLADIQQLYTIDFFAYFTNAFETQDLLEAIDNGDLLASCTADWIQNRDVIRTIWTKYNYDSVVNYASAYWSETVNSTDPYPDRELRIDNAKKLNAWGEQIKSTYIKEICQ